MKHLSRLLSAVALLAATLAQAQPYPAKPVRMVVAFSAGTSVDVISRIILDEVRRKTGLTSVVEHKPGALGAIGTDHVAKSAPDGYTLMPSSSATHSSGPQLVKKAPYDSVADFTHIAALVKFDLLLVVNANSGINSVKDLVDMARRDGKKINYGYGSATSQIAASGVSRAMGIEAQGIPYKGQPLAINDLLGGQVHFVVADVGAVAAQVRAGRLKALGILSEKRSQIFPEVPSLFDQGIKVELPGWVGLAGPAGMPREVVAWWEKQVAEALTSPEVVQRFRGLGFEPVLLSGQPFGQFVRAQYGTWGQLIKEAGIVPE